MYALILPKNDYMSNFPKYKLNSKKDILQMIKSMVHMSEKTSLKTYAEARSTIPVASSCLQHVCRQLAEELRNMFLCCSEDKFGVWLRAGFLDWSVRQFASCVALNTRCDNVN